MRLHQCDGTPDCFGCRIKTVSMAPSAMPTRSPGAVESKVMAERANKDLDAYRRLIASGVQPAGTKNAHAIESLASTTYEVERGGIIRDAGKRKTAEKLHRDIKAARRANAI